MQKPATFTEYVSEAARTAMELLSLDSGRGALPLVRNRVITAVLAVAITVTMAAITAAVAIVDREGLEAFASLKDLAVATIVRRVVITQTAAVVRLVIAAIDVGNVIVVFGTRTSQLVKG